MRFAPGGGAPTHNSMEGTPDGVMPRLGCIQYTCSVSASRLHRALNRRLGVPARCTFSDVSLEPSSTRRPALHIGETQQAWRWVPMYEVCRLRCHGVALCLADHRDRMT